jgi:cytochrome P450
VTRTSGVYYDPYDVGINADPYPTFRRLRDEAPIYHNERHDIWALSRYADVEKGCVDWQTLSNSRSDILDIIKAASAGMQLPGGVILFEDPPLHTMHRSLMSRVFTPRRMNALEGEVRDFCAKCLDPFVGGEQFDFSVNLGIEMPMKVIGMLLGIPDSAQPAVRDKADAILRTEPGKPMNVKQEEIANGEMFAEYVEWRAKHPSDDLMTVLLNAEFEDETGAMRKLTRTEVLTYTQVLAGAGNETTGRLIGWLGKVLAEHPDQRRELVRNPSSIPNAVEETLRFEPTGPALARYVMRDVEYYGQTVPEGSAMLLLVAAANRDERRHVDPDRFDIHREDVQHLTFGRGVHFCLGASLARLEARVALEEVLKRFPDWEIDYENAKMAPTSATMRGWETMPVFLR